MSVSYNTPYMPELRYPLTLSFNGGYTSMLFLRLDQAFELLQACKNQKETLVVRYFMFNGLSPMELANARIEHLDPKECELFMPRRHWKNNQVTDIDQETVKLQIIYSGQRKKGPLIRNELLKCHYNPKSLWLMVKRIAKRTTIPSKEQVCPLILKRTFARIFLKTDGNTVLDLQGAFSHRHISSTQHYARYVLDDVKVAKRRMMEKIKHEEAKSARLVSR